MTNRNTIIDIFFTSLLECNVNYIIPRKYELIYDSSIEDDIDIIVKPSSFINLKKIAKELGFKLIKDRSFFHIYLYGSGPHYHFYNYKNDIHLDVVQKWQHKSINYDICASRVIYKWLPVHELLQVKMWDSVKLDSNIKWARVTSNEIELTHIMCHVLLDKKDISLFYQKKIQELIGESNEDEVLSNLELVFYKFSAVYLNLCKTGKFKEIHKEYISFGGY